VCQIIMSLVLAQLKWFLAGEDMQVLFYRAWR